MHLDVKPVRQQNPIWCGPAVAEMVLNWHGLKIAQKRIAAEIPVISDGVKVARLCQYFVSKGFDTTLRFWFDAFPKEFEGIWGDGSTPKVMEVLEWGAKRCKGFTKYFCSEARAFVKRGGKIEILAPNFMGIENELKRRHPVVMPVAMKVIRGGVGPIDRHYLLVVGCSSPDSQVTKVHFTAINSYTGKELFLPADEMLNACRAMYNCVIFIKPRN